MLSCPMTSLPVTSMPCRYNDEGDATWINWWVPYGLRLASPELVLELWIAFPAAASIALEPTLN